jgi:hypothetical protein
MNVLSVPLRLRLAVGALFLCIPFIAIEVAIATRAPWWKLPYRNMSYWALSFALICIPLSVWLVAAKKWAFKITFALSGVWIFISVWVAIRMQYPPLGFFAIFLLFCCFVVLNWLKQEMERSFFDPQMSWFQGLPKPIPGLQCQLMSGEKIVDLRVGRIDRDGVFVFSQVEGGKPSTVLSSLLEKRKLEMVFNFRDRRIACQGTPTLSVGLGIGAGIQFMWVSADLRKEIGDFVEVLRGEGYV